MGKNSGNLIWCASINVLVNFHYHFRALKVVTFLARKLSEVLKIVCAILSTVKPVLSGHSKIEKTKILMTTGSLMNVESIA